MERIKVVMAWSGGKDASMALHRLLCNKKYEVLGLMSTFSEETERLSMHGIRQELIQAQADAMNLPLHSFFLPSNIMKDYEKSMEVLLLKLKEKGVNHIAFGDIFLEDLKNYRENQLKKVGMKAIFPLWKENTLALVKAFESNGFKSVCCCLDSKKVNQKLLGKNIDTEFISGLSAQVDPCGENGEFHSFCFEGPIFEQSISFALGETLEKTYVHDNIESSFSFVDILLKKDS